MIRLLFALLFNQFIIALRRRTDRQFRGKGPVNAGGAMVEIATAPKPFRPIRCSLCDGRLEESFYRRIPAVTKLERFLQDRRFRLTAFGHAAQHIQVRYGFPKLTTQKALEIRRGSDVATAEQQQHIALTVSNLLGEFVPSSMLFDDAVVVEFPAARRQA